MCVCLEWVDDDREGHVDYTDQEIDVQDKLIEEKGSVNNLFKNQRYCKFKMTINEYLANPSISNIDETKNDYSKTQHLKMSAVCPCKL